MQSKKASLRKFGMADLQRVLFHDMLVTGQVLDDLRRQYLRSPVAAERRIEAGRVWLGVIWTDRRILMRVSGNMLKNALEAASPGQVVRMDCFDRCLLSPGWRLPRCGPNSCAGSLARRGFGQLCPQHPDVLRSLDAQADLVAPDFEDGYRDPVPNRNSFTPAP